MANRIVVDGAAEEAGIMKRLNKPDTRSKLSG
jgi:hypothetical protein